MVIGIAISPGIRSSLARPEVFLGWYWLTFALAVFLTVSVYARREPGLRPRNVVLLGHAFAIYSLLWIVAGYWALGRLVRGRRDWHKTERLIDKPSKSKAVASDAP